VRLAAAGPAVPIRGEVVLSAGRAASILIEPRYCGPADRANGGYLAGVLSRFFEAPFQLTFRRPIPLGRPVAVQESGAGEVQLVEDGTVLAEATAAPFDISIPPAPTVEQAAAATGKYVALQDHPFPRCFVCGTQRATGDGLRIFAGPIDDETLVASPWTPHVAFSDRDGLTRAEVVWAALDCPGCFAAFLERQPGPAVLGRFTARVERRPRAGERCLVYGWPVQHDGRKHQVGTAIVDEEGGLIGCASATWIDVPHGDRPL
jgi:hypothetical protein